MTVFEWLPFAALADERVESCLKETVGLWARRWFVADEKWHLGKIETVTRTNAAARTLSKWHDTGAGMAHGASDKQMLALGLSIVDAPDPAPACNPTDTELLTSLAKGAVADLVQSIAKAIGAAAPPAPQENPFAQTGGLILHVGSVVKDVTALKIAVPAYLLVGYRKAFVQSPKEIVQQRGQMSDAIGDQAIRIAVPLGSATLSINDMRQLEEGDVIPLDTLIEGTFALHASPGGKAFCNARLSQSGGELQIKVAG